MKPQGTAGEEVAQPSGQRKLLMPRAMGNSELAGNWVTINTVHNHPLAVVNGAATMNVALAFSATGPTFSSLEVFAGAAFEALSVATETLLRVDRNVSIDRQLNALSVDFSEDYGRPLDQGSMSGLRLFLLVHQEVLPPKSISADSTGRIEATWEAARGQSASLKFLDDEKFHYALVVETSSGRKRPWGTSGRFEVFVARPEARAILGEGTTAPVPTT